MASDKILRDYVMKNDKKSEIFHTSGVAATRSGASMGAASTQGFGARRAVDRGRSVVGGYKDSAIMRGAGVKYERAQTYNASQDLAARRAAGGVRGADGVGGTGNAGAGSTGNTGAAGNGALGTRAQGLRDQQNLARAQRANGTLSGGTRNTAPLMQKFGPTPNGPKPMRQAPPRRSGF